MKIEIISKGPRVSFLKVGGRVVEVRVGRRDHEGAEDAEAVMRFVMGRLK